MRKWYASTRNVLIINQTNLWYQLKQAKNLLRNWMFHFFPYSMLHHKLAKTGAFPDSSLSVLPPIGFPHYDDVIMDAIVSLITSLMIVYSTIYSDADQRKHQSSASLAFVWGIQGGPVNPPHKWPVTRKIFPFDDVIMLHYMQAAVTFQ